MQLCKTCHSSCCCCAGSVLAQGGPAELKFPAQIFIGYIYCNYGAHEHLGGAFANFGSQVGFLCSDCAESDRIDYYYYALAIDYVLAVQPASVPSSPNPGRIRPYQPRRCSSQGLVLSRPYSSLSMKGAEKHRFPAVRAVEERTTSAGWRHDISRFSDLLLCPPVRRAIPCCSRGEQTAVATRSGCGRR